MESKLREHRHRTAKKSAPELRDSIEGHSGGVPFRVLHVDDNPDDRALVARELQREIPNLSVTEVSDKSALDNALRDADFDLVITDYELIWGNGLQLLQRLRLESPDVPVVMFTGSGNEEIAVEAMKAGVQDYILKSPKYFGRLRTSVLKALERLKYSAELAQAEARYKDLFDTVPVGLFRCTPQGWILDGNPAFVAMAGRKAAADVINKQFEDFHADPGEFGRWRDELERDGSVACVESRFKTPDGSIRWVEIHARAVRDPKTREIFYEGSIEDITERKEVEAERERLIGELRAALGKVNSLTGLLPICSSCKKIRENGGRWTMLESFIESHSQAHFTHSFCPDCARKLYPEVFVDRV